MIILHNTVIPAQAGILFVYRRPACRQAEIPDQVRDDVEK